MSDNANPTDTTTASVSTPIDTPSAPVKSKPNGKTRRARPRRRGAQSDESDDEKGGESDGSLTDASSVSEEDDEESDEEVVEEAVSSKPDEPSSSTPADPAAQAQSAKSSSAPVFADTTPLAWADQPVDNPVEDVSFEDFSGRGRGRGRGRGGIRGGGLAGERRELSEEALKRQAEKRERKKERLKEKRKEKKAAAKLEKQSGVKADKKEADTKVDTSSAPGPSAPAKKGKKPVTAKSPIPESTPDLADETLSLSIQDETPSANSTSETRRPNPRDVYQQKVAADPKFTPRVGGFWTHDQRHYGSGEVGNGYAGLRGMSGYWRGQHQHPNFRGDRGFRGMGRGRGRGGFGPGGQFGNIQGQGPVELGIKEEKRDGRLEMDKLEEEERLRAERIREERERREAEVKEAEMQVEAETVEETASQEQPVVEVPKQQKPANKWGHEGFEQQVELEKHMAFRGGFRGGRGRARGFGGRGGFFGPGPRAHVPPAQPPQFPAQVNGSAPQTAASPASGAAIPASAGPVAEPVSRPAAEEQSTQSAVDDLLADTSSVTVHLPGSNESVDVPRVAPPKPTATQVSAPVDAPAAELTSAPPAQTQPAPAASLDQHQSLVGPSPLPMHLTGGSHRSHHGPSTPFAHGSENGSISSSNYMPPPAFLPPGIGMTPNGEYFNLANGAPVDFHPTAQIPMEMMSPGGMGNGRPYFPAHPRQSSGYQFSPGGQPSPQPQMFYPGVPTPPIGMGMNGFDPSARSDSPFAPNPYIQNQQMGYFIPPAPTKRVSIRPPTVPDQDPSESPLPTSTTGTKSGKSRLSMNGNTFVPQYQQQQQQQQQQYFAQPYNPYTVMQGQMEGMDYGYQRWQGDQGQVGGYQEGYAYQEGYGY